MNGGFKIIGRPDKRNRTLQDPKGTYKAGDVLMRVYEAMSERGYDPVNQIVGYLTSGDPTYITSYNNARYLIRMLERDELLEELVKYYVESHGPIEGE